MSETTAPAAGTPAAESHSIKRYIKAWGVLLAITILMVVLPTPTVILLGIAAKIAIIAAVFMHLMDERGDFVIIIGFSIVFFAAILFALIVPDALAM
ncbi:MAG: hypothetical protein ACYTGZ_13100 [Planctomycetota bacterium]|jgi:cytochrome c oxidase subunit IV